MIAIIQYNAGNVLSVQNALHRLNCLSVVTDKPDEIILADKVIFPGVGHADAAMNHLQKKGLDKVIPSLKQPVMGICLGLQLLCKHTQEGDVDCLKVFDTDVKKFPAADKVPHMGWNNFLSVTGTLLEGISPNENVYYVHSYYAEICKHTMGVCDYIKSFSAVLERDNFYATQFHPEKSGSIGQNILKNFLEL